MHRADRQQRNLLLVLAGVTLFVACLGLVGLVAYRADRRRAEIGVRKTLGASTASIIGLFTTDVLRWVGVAFVLAVPMAYGVATTWLAPFAYRIDLGPAVFGGAGLVVALLAVVVTVSQVRHAAQIDPATAIRGE
jgi:putative ABC transport system permease protein